MPTEEACPAAVASWLSARSLRCAVQPDGRGRTLVACRHFQPGEVLLRQAPYAAVTLPSANVCESCYEGGVGGKLLRERRCGVARYCSSACQSAAWPEHQAECASLGRVAKEGRKVTPTLRLAQRVLLRQRRQRAGQGSMADACDGPDLVDGLLTHNTDLSDDRRLEFAQMATLVASLVDAAGTEPSTRAAATLLQALACNVHTISDGEAHAIGVGLYPLVAMANHSCAPSCALLFQGATAMVRAVRPIATGDEITLSYIDILAPAAERRAALRLAYHFDCGCPRCLAADSGAQEDVDLASWGGDPEAAASADGLIRDAVARRAAGDSAGARKAAMEAMAICNQGRAGPASARRARAADELADACILLTDWADALDAARQATSAYRLAYGNSPLLGLHEFKIGKLEMLLEHSEAAAESLARARAALEVSHGASHPLLKAATVMLSQALTETRCQDEHARTVHV